MTLQQNQRSHPAWEGLPEKIKTYLSAHAGGDGATALTAFTTDAVVTDEGRDHSGREAIAAWLAESAGEYTYTTEFTGAATTDDGRIDVLQHLAGDFPDGEADLYFRFTLAGELISRLVIEP
ncbi:nuclear transport factor 2 family protein [Mycobacterium sp. NPDC003323]